MAEQPPALRLANSTRRLLALAREYARLVESHRRGATNDHLIDNAAEELEIHAHKHGVLMDRVNRAIT